VASKAGASYAVLTVPGKGALYQAVETTLARGAAISAANTAVTNSKRKLVFAPATNGSGTPYTTFTYSVSLDGSTASAQVTINIISTTTAPAAGTALIKAKIQLSGVTAAAFTASAQDSFKTGVAAADPDITANDVIISSFSDVTVRRQTTRGLLATALQVDFAVSAPASSASKVSSSLTTSSLSSNIASAGLANTGATVSGVAVAYAQGPTIQSLSPPHGKTDVAHTLSQISITFSEGVKLATSPSPLIVEQGSKSTSITLSSSNVVISGAQVVINLPAGSVGPGAAHTVKVADRSFAATSNNNFADSPSSWMFTTTVLPVSAPAPSDDDNDGPSTGVIVGAVVGSVAGVGLLAAAGFFLYKRSVRARTELPHSAPPLDVPPATLPAPASTPAYPAPAASAAYAAPLSTQPLPAPKPDFATIPQAPYPYQAPAFVDPAQWGQAQFPAPSMQNPNFNL